MPRIPRDRIPDSTLLLLREGYRFLPNRFRRHKSNIFRTRLALKRTFCVSGPEAAEMFYTPDRFAREGAMPPTARLLQDKGSVQMLEGEEHRHRKAMFMHLMTEEGIEGLLEISGRLWAQRIEEWSGLDRIVLLDEIEHLLCAATCEWAGLRLSENSLSRRTIEFSAMLSSSAMVGPDAVRATLLRERSRLWARKVIRDVRSGRRSVRDTSPLSIIARHRDEDRELLPAKIAAVELINVLRPIVAVARYIVCTAHALELYPENRVLVANRDGKNIDSFTNEIRRWYPFFPFIGGIAQESFTWRDHQFRKGDRVLLDIYGTNRDRRYWDRADEFRPTRFDEWDENPFAFIPQGGGDYGTTHRCPGDGITTALMKQAATIFARDITYRVPPQDLSISLRIIPTQPASGFIITDVRRRFCLWLGEIQHQLLTIQIDPLQFQPVDVQVGVDRVLDRVTQRAWRKDLLNNSAVATHVRQFQSSTRPYNRRKPVRSGCVGDLEGQH
jgi:fatty-acid peroxygenase